MSVKKKTKRDYTSMKSVGVKNIDETFKVTPSLPPSRYPLPFPFKVTPSPSLQGNPLPLSPPFKVTPSPFKVIPLLLPLPFQGNPPSPPLPLQGNPPPLCFLWSYCPRKLQ